MIFEKQIFHLLKISEVNPYLKNKENALSTVRRCMRNYILHSQDIRSFKKVNICVHKTPFKL